MLKKAVSVSGKSSAEMTWIRNFPWKNDILDSSFSSSVEKKNENNVMVIEIQWFIEVSIVIREGYVFGKFSTTNTNIALLKPKIG